MLQHSCDVWWRLGERSFPVEVTSNTVARCVTGRTGLLSMVRTLRYTLPLNRSTAFIERRRSAQTVVSHRKGISGHREESVRCLSIEHWIPVRILVIVRQGCA